MAYTLRGYQERMIAGVLNAFRTEMKVLLCAPTAAGKTIIARHLIYELFKDKKIFFICNREELVKQTAEKFGDVGIIKAGMEDKIDLSKRVQVMMAQTLHARWEKLELPTPELVLIDEVHCFQEGKKIYEGILNNFGGARFLGLTATPMNSRGYLLEGWKSIVDPVQTRDLQAEGWLVNERWFVGEELDLSGVGVQNGDYKTGELSDEMQKPTIVSNIFQNYERLCSGKRTMIFATDIAHAETLGDTFRRKGYDPYVIHSQMEDPKMRAEYLKRFEAEDGAIMINVLALTTGVDIPNIEALIMARPTKSLRLAIQCVGRGLRTVLGPDGKPDKEAKSECIILDCGNIIQTFGGLPTNRRDFEEQEFKVNVDQEMLVGKKCLSCSCFVEGKKKLCPECGDPMDRKKCGKCQYINEVGIFKCANCNEPLSTILNQIDQVATTLQEFQDVEDLLFEAPPTLDNLSKLFAYAERKDRLKKGRIEGYRKKAYDYMMEEVEHNLEVYKYKPEKIQSKMRQLIQKSYNPFAIRYKFPKWDQLSYGKNGEKNIKTITKS